MSIECSKAVYWNVHDTSPAQQSVLAALAFCHNSKTGRCDPSVSTISDMTHFGRSSVNRALDKLKEKHYITWISGGKGKKAEANSNKYTLYLPVTTSHSDTPPVSERDGDRLTVIHPLSQSETQKRIESKSNPNLKKELAGLVGDAFDKAAKPQAPKVALDNAEAAENVGLFNDFWAAYPACKYKTPVARGECAKSYAQLRRQSSDGDAFDKMILASLNAWRESKQWERDGGKYIPAPINFFMKEYWTMNPEPADPEAKLRVEKKKKLLELAKKTESWNLCQERCEKFKDGKCSAGVRIPPDKDEIPIPSEECLHFVPLTSGE